MSILALLANLNTVLGLVHTIEGLIGKVAQTKAMPPIADVLALIDEVEAIFKSGVIKIQGVDDQAIASALQMVRDQLSAADKAGLLSAPKLP